MIELTFSHDSLNIFASVTSDGRKQSPFLVRLWVGPLFSMKTYPNKKQALAAVHAALAA